MSSRNAAKSRQAQIFMQFHKEVSTKDFFSDFFQIISKWEWNDANDFDTKYGTNLDDYNTFTLVSMQFDSLGTLVRNKLTDIKFMPRGISIMVTSFWEKFRPIAPQLEEIWGNADMGECRRLWRDRIPVQRNKEGSCINFEKRRMTIGMVDRARFEFAPPRKRIIVITVKTHP
ncbi:MAG: hypothetical protein ACXAC0_05245 [Candidatus Thorarchaeota archaeon]